MSFTTKVMLMLLAMMLTVTIAISVILISQSTANIDRQHNDTQLRNLRRYELLQGLLTNRMLLWVETFAQFGADETSQENALVAAMEKAKEPLNLSLQIDRMWLFNPQGTLISGEESQLPGYVARLIPLTQQQLRPRDVVACEQACRHYLSVPVMTANQHTAVIVLSSSLQELFALLSQSTNAKRLAVVRRSAEDSNGAATMEIVSQLSPANTSYINNILLALPATTDVNTLIKKGIRLKMQRQSLLVSLLPLEHAIQQNTYILFVHDITADVAAANSYQQNVIGSAIGLFALFALLMYLLLNQYRQKLLRLSRRLPLLAERRYDDFKARSQHTLLHKRGHLTDELDVLEQTATNLAIQLEDIDSKMALTTAQLENMAMFDSLTGLPNRNMLNFQIDKQIAASAREPKTVALMFLDLDDFKKVNDSHGHEVGDKLLKAAAERIVRPIRETDIASRFGGDEFVVLLSHIESREEVEVVAEKLIQAFTTPIEIGELHFYISVSIGIAITQYAESTAVELLRSADIAMYEAKAQQGAAYRIFDSTMNLKVMRKVELESEARIALREDHFSLALQPQLDLKTRKLVGFEALIRWYHPTKGFISPAEFIPLLENTPFMLELDYWVIFRAMRLLNELRADGYLNIKMAINVSASQFVDSSLPNYLDQQLKKNNIPPQLIELELTETALVQDMARTTEVLKAIREMGCLIAIDDFGTGYSSLSYLKALPADLIKIDRSFIAGMLDSPDDRSIVFSTISMVKNMGLTVIAEGLETQEQYELLCHFDCHQGQGYLISPPIPEKDLWSVLNEKLTDQVWNTLPPINSASVNVD
ncbi:putative bifunctional diguanylate cyclase/phosphodiesterase [Alteromonas pelagimontana]|nr:EAL domain-containing protein [Alteromonas pelagimontana]